MMEVGGFTGRAIVPLHHDVTCERCTRFIAHVRCQGSSGRNITISDVIAKVKTRFVLQKSILFAVRPDMF